MVDADGTRTQTEMGPKNNSGKNLEKTAGKKMGGDEVGA
jgi:hypothetical protein